MLLNMNVFSVPQPQGYQVMPPQMPPNPFLGAARGMMHPPLPQGPVCMQKYIFCNIFNPIFIIFYFSLE